MNLSKFSFCLGHDDPGVVLKGLESFTAQILTEHDAVDTFGYNGRSTFARQSDDGSFISKSAVTGLLGAYVNASASCEELFTLWGVPGRDDDVDLCVAHMRCFAAILHCISHSRLGLVDNIVSRLVHERGRSIQQQLNSSNISLIHSTQGLIIAMMASSQQNCRNIYQKFLAFNMSVLGNASQKGNAVSWEHPVNKEVTVSTCGRHLTAIILELLVRTEEPEIIFELLTANSLLRKLSNAIARTTTGTALAILRMMFTFVERPSVLSIIGESRNVLLDTSLQETLLALQDGDSDEEVSAITHAFLVKYCRFISGTSVVVVGAASHRGKRGGAGGQPSHSSRPFACIQMIKGLCAPLKLKHRALEKQLLSANPGMLTKVLGTLTGPWDPAKASPFQLLALLSHTSGLLAEVDVPGSFSASMRALVASFGGESDGDGGDGASNEGSSGQGEQQGEEGCAKRVAELADELLRSVLPPSLTKKDLSKLVNASNALPLSKTKNSEIFLAFCAVSPS